MLLVYVASIKVTFSINVRHVSNTLTTRTYLV